MKTHFTAHGSVLIGAAGIGILCLLLLAGVILPAFGQPSVVQGSRLPSLDRFGSADNLAPAPVSTVPSVAIKVPTTQTTIANPTPSLGPGAAVVKRAYHLKKEGQRAGR